MLYHQTRVMPRGGAIDSDSWRASHRFRPIYFTGPGIPPCWGRHDAAHRLGSEAPWLRQGESTAVFDSVGVKFISWVVSAVGRGISKFPTAEGRKRVSLQGNSIPHEGSGSQEYKRRNSRTKTRQVHC